MTWIINNIATIIISFMLVAIIALIVFKLVKDKKANKSSCGCNCAHCAMAHSCHKPKE